MAKRKQISKKLRFEVFKRDNFTCQYCGRKAPDIILEVDHIKPSSKGGDNSIFNLITSCKDCNRGKRNTELTNLQLLEKQREQLEDLQEKENQLKMLQKWYEETQKINQKTFEYFEKVILDICDNCYELSESGIKDLKKYIKKYDKKELLEAIEISFSQYYKDWEDNEEKSIKWNKAFNMIPKIIETQKQLKDEPELLNALYLRGILKNRLNYVDIHVALSYLLKLLNYYTFEGMKSFCIECDTWDYFLYKAEKLLNEV